MAVLAVISGLLALTNSPATAHAGLILSVGDYQQTSATGGTFEITLSNTDSQTYHVASFSFGLMLPASSGVQFAAVSTATVAHDYIFDGTGAASVDPNFMFSFDVFPNTDFTASDTEFTMLSIAVAPGISFGLGLVTYEIGPGPPAGTVPISFVASGTSLSDADGNAIPFTSQGGSIQVQGVPEPSTLILLASAAATLLLVSSARRWWTAVSVSG